MPYYRIRESELLHPERLRQCSRVMTDYMIREFELLHPENLRQCSVRPDYRIRELELGV
jgi:hypothetical protein